MISDKIINHYLKRPPNFIVGDDPNEPYLLRWYVIPRNRFFNIYLHKFLHSDDDRALHDHPWSNMSILLKGSYTEHTIAAGGINHRIIYKAGDYKIRLSGKYTHRIELHDGVCWTLFITGPRYREWGFHCPFKGWVNWKDFTDPKNSGATGKGCGD